MVTMQEKLTHEGSRELICFYFELGGFCLVLVKVMKKQSS